MLCGWKVAFLKSGHICTFEMYIWNSYVATFSYVHTKLHVYIRNSYVHMNCVYVHMQLSQSRGESERDKARSAFHICTWWLTATKKTQHTCNEPMIRWYHRWSLSSACYQDLRDARLERDDGGRRVVLPATFMVDHDNMHERQQDTVSYVRLHRHSDIIFTATTIPNWVQR